MPTETWGTQTLVTAPIKATEDGNDLAVYRILALGDGTEIEFEPEVSTSVSLNSGEYYEVISDEDFWIRTVNGGRFMVQQLLVGALEPGEEHQGQTQDIGPEQYGDPAMGLAIPVFQLRSDYVFFTPSTYSSNWLNIGAPLGAEILLDGTPVETDQPVGNSDWAVTRVLLEPGSHTIHSPTFDNFSITTYGYAPFTSYLFPGGLNIRKYINGSF